MNTEISIQYYVVILPQKDTTRMWIKLDTIFPESVPQVMILGSCSISFLSLPRNKNIVLIAP